ncbi:L-aspartate oxidase [Virgibacillus xinjiangensis]|uniref:L-aspartate oxidase n=1 Tax=Virgibacillus xinjiangensis TaxID=393090 RepID=A0ABV7CRM5_9BACI
MQVYDVIIIGSGLAALTAAGRLSLDRNVILFTKSQDKDSNSYQAQGGVAAAIAADDDWQQHFTDTMNAGAFHNLSKNLEQLTKQGVSTITELIKEGMHFDKGTDGNLDLAKEGGHLKRRILHAGGDATGKALVSFMLSLLKEKVEIREYEMAVDLMIQNGHCIGVHATCADGEIRQYQAPATIIATGGCGQVYTYNSNDSTITGDGIAMAYRAGALLTDMEFIQFHPTVLYQNKRAIGLISEAVRGEGAFLQDRQGNRIMEGVHEHKDLAPRDIVARTIFNEMERGEDVFLNISPVRHFSRRFPTIHQLCKRYGLDPAGQLLPVIPAAHFLMGGIKADSNGETSIDGLFAVGETACTGVHGANRIASNSLLEAMVFGNRTAERILEKRTKMPANTNDSLNVDHHTASLPDKQEISERMSKNVGVIRTRQGLEEMKNWLEQFDFLHINQLTLTKDEIETINMLTVSWLITTSALERNASIGSHFRADYPVPVQHAGRKEIIRHISENIVEPV